jgi:hypothetical protein
MAPQASFHAVSAAFGLSSSMKPPYLSYLGATGKINALE